MNKAIAFFLAFYQEWQRAALFPRAGSLTFSCILALVPVTTLLVALFSVFAISPTLQNFIQQFLFDHFVANSSQAIWRYLQHFIAQAWSLSWWSLVFSLLTAVLILLSLEQSLNVLWQVPSRPYWQALLVYALVILLAPIGLVGALLPVVALSAWVSSDVFNLTETLLAILFNAAVYSSLFKSLPNTWVGWRAAWWGGIIAAVLFEVVKRLFVWYVAAFPSYEIIYGALAAIPLFFLWLYVSWLIFFAGALLSYLCQSHYGVNTTKSV